MKYRLKMSLGSISIHISYMTVALKPANNTSTPAGSNILRFQLCALYVHLYHKYGLISSKIKTMFKEGLFCFVEFKPVSTYVNGESR
jgi:hypothetical protein